MKLPISTQEVELIGGRYDGLLVPNRPYTWGEEITYVERGILHVYAYHKGRFLHVPKRVVKV